MEACQKGICILVKTSNNDANLRAFLKMVNMIKGFKMVPETGSRPSIIHQMKANGTWWEPNRMTTQSPRLWGPRVWAVLYNLAYESPVGSIYTRMILTFQQVIPCGYCKQHFHDIMRDLHHLQRSTPLEQVRLLRYLVQRGNEVSSK